MGVEAVSEGVGMLDSAGESKGESMGALALEGSIGGGFAFCLDRLNRDVDKIDGDRLVSAGLTQTSISGVDTADELAELG